MTKKKAVEEKYISEYIKDMLSDYRSQDVVVDKAKYHHNAAYEKAPLICKHGILTIEDLNKQGLRHDTTEQLKVLDDMTSHANGISNVSLSVAGLDDLYRDEFEWEPFGPQNVDFLVSSDIKDVGRHSVHYGNEFLVRRSVPLDQLRAVDIRLLELLAQAEIKDKSRFTPTMEKVVDNYNNLIETAKAMKEVGLDIPLRQMQQGQYTGLCMETSQGPAMDIDKVAAAPKIFVKK